ncbi:MAG: hypothetical protein GX561_08220 [Lentisphaerae bacterium]|nr:hypothetical protein [Lentisphaerota bacterium]
MKKLFLRAICCLFAVVFVHTSVAARLVQGIVFRDANGNGVFDAGEVGLPDVVVSDSRTLVKTGPDGRYSLECKDDKPIVWVCRPSRMRPSKSFWTLVEADGSVDFGLVPMEQGSDFTFVQITDTHISRADTASWVVDRLNSLPFPVDFVINTGDLVSGSDGQTIEGAQNQYDVFEKGFSHLKLPLFYVCGNHEHANSRHANLQLDHELYGKGMYKQRFGPTVYSFDWGDIHCIVLDCTILLPKGGYREGIDAEQTEWLKGDLAMVPKGKSIIAFSHQVLPRPTASLLEGKGVLAVYCGHLHRTYVRKQADYDIIATPATSGAWWSGPGRSNPNSCGNPQGFRIINVSGGKIASQAYVSRHGDTPVSLASPLKRTHLKGKQDFSVVVMDFGKKVSVTATLGDKPVELKQTERHPQWSVWSGSFDTGSLVDSAHDFVAVAQMEDGTKSTMNVPYSIQNGVIDTAFKTDRDAKLEFMLTSTSIKLEVVANDQVVGTLEADALKDVKSNKGKKITFVIPAANLKRVNSIVLRAAPEQKGKAGFTQVRMTYPEPETGKVRVLRDVRQFSNAKYAVDTGKSGKSSVISIALPD